MVDNRFVRMEPNGRGHFEIAPIGVELGIWHGHYMGMELPWLRYWDLAGNLLPTGDERAEAERRSAKAECQRAEAERQRADRLVQQLRALGAEP